MERDSKEDGRAVTSKGKTEALTSVIFSLFFLFVFIIKIR